MKKHNNYFYLIILFILMLLVGLLLHAYHKNNQSIRTIDELTSQADSLENNIDHLNIQINLNNQKYADIKKDIGLIKDSITILKNKNNDIIKKYKKKYSDVYHFNADNHIDFFTKRINEIEFDSIPN